KVASARKRRFEDIEPVAQGRVWLGDQAKAKGLIDELGGLDRAIELVKKKAQISPREAVTLVTYPPKRTIFDLLFRQPSPEALLQSRILRDSHAKLWLRGGMLRMMPFSLSLH